MFSFFKTILPKLQMPEADKRMWALKQEEPGLEPSLTGSVLMRMFLT